MQQQQIEEQQQKLVWECNKNKTNRIGMQQQLGLECNNNKKNRNVTTTGI
jgi:hypothetical protein